MISPTSAALTRGSAAAVPLYHGKRREFRCAAARPLPVHNKRCASRRDRHCKQRAWEKAPAPQKPPWLRRLQTPKSKGSPDLGREHHCLAVLRLNIAPANTTTRQCNEESPCSNCRRRGERCINPVTGPRKSNGLRGCFPQPSGHPIVIDDSRINLLHLELFHHFERNVLGTLAFPEIWQKVLPWSFQVRQHPSHRHSQSAPNFPLRRAGARVMTGPLNSNQPRAHQLSSANRNITSCVRFCVFQRRISPPSSLTFIAIPKPLSNYWELLRRSSEESYPIPSQPRTSVP